MPNPEPDTAPEEQYVTTNLRLPEDMHKEIKHRAVDEEVSMNKWIVERLRQALGGKKRSEEKK